jgi:hypothetical protein
MVSSAVLLRTRGGFSRQTLGVSNHIFLKISMNKQKLEQLMTSMEDFLQGRDFSLSAANDIEGRLAAFFDDDERFDDILDGLAQYHPSGGDCLYDYAAIKPKMRSALHLLHNECASSKE